MQTQFRDEEPARATEPKLSRQSAPMAPVVVAEHLSKRFATEEAVQDLSFEVHRGAIFGLIGPSGSGKTTTIRLMLGLYRPSEGRVLVLGQRPQHFRPSVRQRLGYMPQEFVLYPHLSVSENLSFCASLYGMGFARGRRFKELLEFVELYEHRHKLARSLSGGMQRRLALAATLLHDPQLIFLDEPTAGIDPVLRSKFWDYFRALSDRGHTVFVTTQYVGEAAHCDLVGVMSEGRMLMIATPHGLRVRAYGGELVDLQAARPLDYGTVTQLRALPPVTGRVQPLGDSGLRLVVADAGTAVPALLDWARDNNLELRSVEKYEPPLDDVFVEVVKKEGGRA